jgi:adenine-specific DNA-methyltransferase
LGQFLTPSPVAAFMGSLFRPGRAEECRLLDAGAGIGSLSAAFLERCASGGLGFQRVVVDAFEIDEGLHPYLVRTLEEYGRHLQVVPRVHGGDFVEMAVGSLSEDLFAAALPRYTHAILNPPYKKIRSNSPHRAALRRVGIETVNLYSAFVALSLGLLDEGGQMVAIIPRSFCNGPYYRPFRDFILERAALRHMHLFVSRDKAFKDDKVLQENIIILLERGAPQGDVTVSGSTDGSFDDYIADTHPFGAIVLADDPERFIRVPNSQADHSLELASNVRFSLADLGIEVSTGPVVDFRLREHIRDMPENGTVPLLYPGHFSGEVVEWPKRDFRKPNAIARNAETAKCLFPTGFYTVVRRFSSKEEKRRIMASIVHPGAFPGVELLGFENHLNVFHSHKHGLPEDLVRGLSAFLNTSALDAHFRCFNGHTQVNATDLRRIKYPSYETLVALGKWAGKHPQLEQGMVDEEVKRRIA